MLNSPIKFNDPTGHEVGSLCDRGYCDEKGNVIKADSPKNKFFSKPKRKEEEPLLQCPYHHCEIDEKLKEKQIANIKSFINGATWFSVPSAIGINFGITGQGGAVMEAGYTPFELLVIYNWRSGQLNAFKSNGNSMYVGSPSLLGGTGYIGITTVYGASRNEFLQGSSRYAGATAQLDLFGKIGVNKIVGYGSANRMDEAPYPFIDPVSKLPVTYRQTNLVGGANLFPDAVDVGLFAGQSDSTMLNWP